MKPIIGILAEVDNDLVTKIWNYYVSAIEKSGGLPVIIPYVRNDATLDSYVDMCDGFLFSGGVDVDPMHYGEEKKPTCEEVEPYRDELELKIFKKIIATKKPVLAICRGAQLVNVALGGTLYQDIPSEVDTSIIHRQLEGKCEPSHNVRIIEGTPLFDLIGDMTMAANSFHHQALKALGNGLKVMATTDDGIAEAVYLDSERYLRAYQWHPERLYDKIEQNRLIFDDFIKACNK